MHIIFTKFQTWQLCITLNLKIVKLNNNSLKFLPNLQPTLIYSLICKTINTTFWYIILSLLFWIIYSRIRFICYTQTFEQNTLKKASIFHVIGFIWSCRKNEGNANVKFYFQLRGTEKKLFCKFKENKNVFNKN